MNRITAWLTRWWDNPADTAQAERRRRFNEELLDDRCGCSWIPAPGASSGALRAAYHGRGTHEDGTGSCSGRDAYGLLCGCQTFVPMRG